MKILAFLSEQYYDNGSLCVAKPTSAKFLSECFGCCDLIIASPLNKSQLSSFSSQVPKSNFEEIEYFSSIKDFVLKCFFNPLFLYRYIRRCNELLNKYPDSILWVRNPSIGSLIFSICAVTRKRFILNHMCANAMNGWKNEKYSLPERYLGFVFSKVIWLMVRYISSWNKTVNLCTGDELFNICKNHNSNTFQFIDVMSTIKSFNGRKKEYDKFKFIFIGRVQRDKGIYELLDVFSEIRCEVNCELTIVGDGVEFDYIMKKYSHLDGLTLTGQVPHHELGRYIKDSDAVVVPSNNSYEGFPRVIMESWCYGKPVVCTDTGGVKAFVKNGENGVLVKVGNKLNLKNEMLNLIHNSDFYLKLKSGSERMAEVSTFDFWSNRLRSIIDEATDEI